MQRRRSVAKPRTAKSRQFSWCSNRGSYVLSKKIQPPIREYPTASSPGSRFHRLSCAARRGVVPGQGGYREMLVGVIGASEAWITRNSVLETLALVFPNGRFVIRLRPLAASTFSDRVVPRVAIESMCIHSLSWPEVPDQEPKCQGRFRPETGRLSRTGSGGC